MNQLKVIIFIKINFLEMANKSSEMLCHNF